MKNLFLLLFVFPLFATAQIGTPNAQTYVTGTVQLTDNSYYGYNGTWSSSNTSLATVTSTGLVTGVGQGTVKIRFVTTGVNDSLSMYVATTDSSGYYFENGGIQKRDCDGVTKLFYWYASSTAQNHFQYNPVTTSYYLIWGGIPNGPGTNYMITIPTGKVKDFGGSAKKSTPDSVLVQMGAYGF